MFHVSLKKYHINILEEIHSNKGFYKLILQFDNLSDDLNDKLSVKWFKLLKEKKKFLLKLLL